MPLLRGKLDQLVQGPKCKSELTYRYRGKRKLQRVETVLSISFVTSVWEKGYHSWLLLLVFLLGNQGKLLPPFCLAFCLASMTTCWAIWLLFSTEPTSIPPISVSFDKSFWKILYFLKRFVLKVCSPRWRFVYFKGFWGLDWYHERPKLTYVQISCSRYIGLLFLILRYFYTNKITWFL